MKMLTKTISFILLMAFIFNECCYGLATLPASQNPAAKIEILAALQRTQIRYAESDYAIKLLAANNAECILLSSGRYLVSKDVAGDDIRLLRAIIHEDIEALMQIMSRDERSKYRGVKRLILERFQPDENNRLPIDLYVNHTIARAFEWITLLNSGLIRRDEIPIRDKAFIDNIEHVINSAKRNYFIAEFWDPNIRGEKISLARNSGMRFYQVASTTPGSAASNKAQTIKDRLMLELKYKTGMDYPFQQLYVELTQRCGVGCEFCMFGSRSIAPSIENTLSEEAIANVIKIVERAKFKKLVITGEGETTLELKNALRLIENAVSPNVIMITSGNWAVSEAAAKSLMDKINAAVDRNPAIKKFEFRVSIDKYHQAKIPMRRLAAIVSTFIKYRNSGDYKKMELFFRSVLFEDDTVDRFAKLLGADISPLKGVHRAMKLPDGYILKVFYKNYTIDYDSAGLDVGKYMSIEDYMKLEAGEDGIYRDAIRDGGINIAIKYDGRINIFGGAKDTVSNIYRDSYDHIMDKISRDIIARTLIDQGPMYVLDICAEVDPDARDRALGYNQPAKIVEEGLNTPELRLYVAVRLVKEYINEGKIDEASIDSDLRGMVKMDPKELRNLYNGFVTDRIVSDLNAGRGNKILLMGGYTSSGKGYTSELIAKRIAEVSSGVKKAVIISMDDYLRGVTEVSLYERRCSVRDLMRNNGLDTMDFYNGREIFDRDSAAAYCIYEMISDIGKIWRGQSVQARKYDFTHDNPYRSEEALMINPENTVVIIEGIHALDKEMIAKLKAATGDAPIAKVFIDEPAAARFARRLIRNSDSRANCYMETLAQWLLVAEEEKNIDKAMGRRAMEGITILSGKGDSDAEVEERAVQVVGMIVGNIIKSLTHADLEHVPKPSADADSVIKSIDAIEAKLSSTTADVYIENPPERIRLSPKAVISILSSVKGMLDDTAVSLNAPKGLDIGSDRVKQLEAEDSDRHKTGWGLIQFTGDHRVGSLSSASDAIEPKNAILEKGRMSTVDLYDAESATVLLTDLIYAQLQKGRIYEVKYDVSRLTSSQVEIMEEYVKLLQTRSSTPDNIRLRPFSSAQGSKESLIAVYCTGKDFKGEGHVDVTIPDGELKEYLLRIAGMVNIALASSNVPDNLLREDVDKYRPIMSYIKNQYKAIMGEGLSIPDSPEDILKVIRRIMLGLPKSMRMNIEQIEEFNRLAKQTLTAA